RQATVDWANQHDERRLLARGAERPILNHDRYQAGYEHMREALDHTLDGWHSATGAVHANESERQAVRDIALHASQNVRENRGDRGRGPERLDDPDFDRGSRKAIMDWSHEQNHRLAMD